MRRRFTTFTEPQQDDLLFLLKERYDGNVDTLGDIWELTELDLMRNAASKQGIEESIPTIEELKAGAYRQLKGAIVKSVDPQKLANTLKILEDMKDRDEGKGMEEKAKGIAESIASLADAEPPAGLENVSLEPVVSDHIKKPRRRPSKPSKEVNGLDENSDTP